MRTQTRRSTVIGIEQLEDRVVPAACFAVGTSGGTVGTVTMYNPDRTVQFTAAPFGAGFTGGVKVAVADVTGDGVADVVAAADGDGTTPARVAVVDGATFTVSTPAFLPSVYAGPVSVAVGDADKDGVADVALGTSEGGPHARVYRGKDFAKLADFTAAGTSGYTGRTEVSLGDVTGDGHADLVLTAGFGNVTKVLGFSGATVAAGTTPSAAFTPFTLAGDYGGGVYLSTGDLNGDGYADLAFGTSAGSARAKVYSGKEVVSGTLATLASFTPAGASTTDGVRVAVRDVNGDGRADLLTSSGGRVTAVSGTKLSLSLRPTTLFSFDPDPNATTGFSVG